MKQSGNITMKHDNKNLILDFHYKELEFKKLQNYKTHLQDCGDCQKYLQDIKQTEKFLNNWSEEETPDFILDNIINDISASKKVSPIKEKSNLLMPIIQIAFGVVFILLLIYILTLKLSTSSFLSDIQNNWFIITFGNFGLAVLILLAIGTFFSLSLAPVLLFETKRNEHLV